MPIVTAGGLPLFRFQCLSDVSAVVHGISTRRGGVSRPPWATLNLSLTKGDDPAHVAENQRRVCRALHVAPETIVTAFQVHGTRVAVVTAAQRGQQQAQCDALITDTPGVALMLRFADCTPVLLYDPRRRAIGLAHAGWRGTVAGVAAATVTAMTQAFGSQPADLVAAIGPAIGPCCYAVGDDVISQVHTHLAQPDTLLSQVNGHPHFDLWAANAQQLQHQGVPTIEVAGLCTACHRDWFYSHRAEQGRCGHFAALLALDDRAGGG